MFCLQNTILGLFWYAARLISSDLSSDFIQQYLSVAVVTLSCHFRGTHSFLTLPFIYGHRSIHHNAKILVST